MSARRGRSRRGSDDGGAAAVEFALVLIVLVLIVMGIVQFGVTYSQWLQVVHAAREGARWASLQRPADEVRSRVTAASAPMVPKAVDITPGGYDLPGGVGDPVTVTVYFDSSILTPLMRTLFGVAGVKELRSSATLRVE